MGRCPTCSAPLRVAPLAIISRTGDPRFAIYPMVVALATPANCTECDWAGEFREALK